MSMFGNVQPAIKKETGHVALYTGIGVVLMWAVFLLLHISMPEKVPFDYTVILGGACGGLVAVLNFFLMGLTVQKVASSGDTDMARWKLRSSYTQRMALQFLWGVAAIAAPCFHFAAGLLPLLFPGIGIKIGGIFMKR